MGRGQRADIGVQWAESRGQRSAYLDGRASTGVSIHEFLILFLRVRVFVLAEVCVQARASIVSVSADTRTNERRRAAWNRASGVSYHSPLRRKNGLGVLSSRS